MRYRSPRIVGRALTPEPARGFSARSGQLYEERGHVALEREYQEKYRRWPRIRYYDTQARSYRYCVPDALLSSPKRIYLIEYKLSHTGRVWAQLMETYVPLIKLLFPDREVFPVEICRRMDHTVSLPRTPYFIRRFEDAKPDTLNIWPRDFRTKVSPVQAIQRILLQGVA